MKYLVRMFKRKEGYWTSVMGIFNSSYYSPESIKNYFYEVEVDDNMDKFDFYQMVEKMYPNLRYGNRYVLKEELPNGWKRIKGALTAPNGYYWANNGKSLWDKSYQSALIKEN